MPSRPALLLVESDPAELERIGTLLRRRFGPDFDVLTAPASEAAQGLVASMPAEQPLALVLAANVLRDGRGNRCLSAIVRHRADAMRVLLVGWPELWGGGTDVRRELTRSAVLGEFDSIVVRPAGHPEHFYAALGQLLATWTARRSPNFEAVRVIGARLSPETYALRDVLQRGSVPHTFLEAESPEGRAALATLDRDVPLPVAVLHDGRVLARPDIHTIARALGVNSTAGDSVRDLVVVGAGPSGLASAVYGASEGLDVLVIEPEAHGGQAGTSSMIRNYLGFPFGISGADLAARAYEQAYFFGAGFIFGRRAVGLRVDGDVRVVALDDGSEVRARAVVLATGVSYRRLGIESVDRLLGRGVYYGAAMTEAPAMRGEDVFVVGAANSAGQAAVYLARFARSVTLLVRGPSLADGMSDYLVREIGALENVHVRTGTEVTGGEGEAQLRALVLRDRENGGTETVPGSALFILIGAAPRTDWLPPVLARDPGGFVLTGEEASASEGASRGPLETSMGGVFAVGDVRAESIKRVAAAVGEGSAAVRYVHTYLASIRRSATDAG